MQHLPSRSACARALLVLGALAGTAAANETGLGGAPFWTVTAPGADFYQASTTTRAGLAPAPLSITLPALPAGTQVVDVVACWGFLLNGNAPPLDTIGINGNPVTGSFVGQGIPDLGWGKARGVAYVASGLAPLVQLGGANAMNGVLDKALGSDPAAFGAGLTILVVTAKQHGVEQRVSLWAGYSSTESSANGSANVSLSLPTPYQGGLAHLFLNALDGVDLTGPNDTFEINGTSVGGLLAGTGGPNDAWKGLAGPAASNNLYDRLDDSIASLMGVGDVEIKARTAPSSGGPFSDTIGHTFAAFAGVEPCGSWATYCTAKVNSQGCTPTLSASGSPSVSPLAGPFQVRVQDLLNNMNGLLFYGYAQQISPFQNGYLCVAAPVVRTGAQNAGGSASGVDCTGKMTFDFNAYVQSGVDPLLVVGATVFAQYWTRDPADPFGSNLSAGICFTLCP